MRTTRYGVTGEEVSRLGFGGMRFPDPQDEGACVDLVLHAHAQGISYFDTAPGYCADRSESIFGAALAQVPRGTWRISTKCGAHEGGKVRDSIERSRERLRVGTIDFFHIWCLMGRDDLERRRAGGAIEAALQARADGLVRHVVCSAHMPGDELAAVLREGTFAGVTLGYNAVNFPYRAAAVDCAGALGLGVVTMNPLGGGLIAQNPQRFPHLAEADPDRDVVRAALRFNASHPAISVVLVGFAARAEIDAAVAALGSWEPWTAAQRQALAERAAATFDDLCTGCGYCQPCPQELPIPQLMDAWNQAILAGDDGAALNRLRHHWNLTQDVAARCTACGRCEPLCTQHLPISERMRRLAELKR